MVSRALIVWVVVFTDKIAKAVYVSVTIAFANDTLVLRGAARPFVEDTPVTYVGISARVYLRIDFAPTVVATDEIPRTLRVVVAVALSPVTRMVISTATIIVIVRMTWEEMRCVIIKKFPSRHVFSFVKKFRVFSCSTFWSCCAH